MLGVVAYTGVYAAHRQAGRVRVLDPQASGRSVVGGSSFVSTSSFAGGNTDLPFSGPAVVLTKISAHMCRVGLLDARIGQLWLRLKDLP